MADAVETVGLFNISRGPDYVLNELVKCIDLANDGVHAILLVLSIRTRFSREEQATFQSLLDLFGSKISDYMIVVFTGGDEFDENDETLDDYLGHCPEALQGTLSMCGERRVLFDNKTKDPKKMAEQLRNLLLHVNLVVEKNGGKPYTSDLFKDLKVDFKLRLDIKHLEEEVAKERAARLEAEESIKVAQKKREDMSRLMRASFGRQRQRATEELQATNLRLPGMCLIL
ncbi:putative protein phloem protein 2-like a3 [Nicotiana attenuata]|uniref:AIG1-type G domain-containing protein n=2 Tax=Nicotiana attenuata TaxID=49451 RepID=A0A1J6I5R6_NICAT|nr:putative protein phloem protein 2-like a3 [Nicotiana attenuata]